MPRTLIIGYGNTDRQDDGVAWHVLAAVASRLGRPKPVSYEDEFQFEGLEPELVCGLQLTPELAESASAYDRVCFIDAHTGRVPETIQAVPVEPEFQSSPFTHHLMPNSFLSLAENLYGKRLAGFLVSVRGYEFGFDRALSPETAALVDLAADQVLAWCCA